MTRSKAARLKSQVARGITPNIQSLPQSQKTNPESLRQLSKLSSFKRTEESTATAARLPKEKAKSDADKITKAKQKGKMAASSKPMRFQDKDEKSYPSAKSGGRPNPTLEYIVASSVEPRLLEYPQHLLVVIDLNGTLLFRPQRTAPTKFVMRPHAQSFLKYCLDTFTVVIWSSTRPENTYQMCDALLAGELKDRVVAIWGRDKFGLTMADYNSRVQCYKRLTKLWQDPAIAKSHPLYEFGVRWDQTNTVLIDDSVEKARSEPHNLIEIPEFSGNMNEGSILPQVHDYLNYLSTHSNVSACVRDIPFKAQLQL
ncbi:Protein-serine/threonine phosphatase/4-nitrophenylphosphatase [Chlorociboria aeruginascens]|nr:Protein-serine/threonine phosphatase/4-nitrophenylphosphatase [Chlorociboria aeruginascens]